MRNLRQSHPTMNHHHPRDSRIRQTLQHGIHTFLCANYNVIFLIFAMVLNLKSVFQRFWKFEALRVLSERLFAGSKARWLRHSTGSSHITDDRWCIHNQDKALASQVIAMPVTPNPSTPPSPHQLSSLPSNYRWGVYILYLFKKSIRYCQMFLEFWKYVGNPPLHLRSQNTLTSRLLVNVKDHLV